MQAPLEGVLPSAQAVRDRVRVSVRVRRLAQCAGCDESEQATAGVAAARIAGAARGRLAQCAGC